MSCMVYNLILKSTHIFGESEEHTLILTEISNLIYPKTQLPTKTVNI